MSYVKQNFSGGQVLTATNLNHMEEGIADVVEKTSKVINAPVNKFMQLIDGGDLLPGVITPYWTETCSEVCDMLRDGYKNNLRFGRWVMDKENQNQPLIHEHTGFELYSRENNQEVGARILFGDLQPIILDAVNNKVKLDPDWVAPAAAVKSINDIIPDESGNIALGKVLRTTSSADAEEDGMVISNPTRCFNIIDGSNFGIPLNTYNQFTAKILNDTFRQGFINTCFKRSVMLDKGSIEYYCTKVEKITNDKWVYYFGDNLAPIIADSVNNTFELDPDWVAPNTNQQVGIIYNPMMDTYSSTHTYEQLCALGAELLEVMYCDSAITNNDYPAAVNYMRTLSVKYNRNPANATGYLEFTFLDHENNGYIVIRINSNNTIEK